MGALKGTDRPRIGLIGAGMIGSTLARLLVASGHEIRLSSRDPTRLGPLVDHLGEQASAGTPMSAAHFSNVVIVSVPLKAIPDLARELGPALTGKTVLDTGNAYEQRDGEASRDARRFPGGSAAWAAAMFPGSHWVKAFNTVYFQTLSSQAHRAGERLGIPLAGDDSTALATAAQLVDEIGFDPVVVGPLVRGKEFEPGTKVYNAGMSAREIRAALGLD